jgi:hypothetical protein
MALNSAFSSVSWVRSGSGQEDYPLPERTQETLENALFNAISAFMSTHQRKMV